MTTETELARTFAEFLERAESTAIWMGKSTVFNDNQNTDVYLKIIRNLDLAKQLAELQRAELEAKYMRKKAMDEYQMNVEICQKYFDIIDATIDGFVKIGTQWQRDQLCTSENNYLCEKVNLREFQLKAAKEALTDATLRWNARKN